METKPISEKKPFITINALIPFQVLKIIPNDDLSEIYLKSRVISFIKFSFFFSLLSVILFYALGIEIYKAVGLSLAVGVAYILLRIMLSNDEQAKLLSEEITFKLSERERYKKIADESEAMKASLDAQLETLYLNKITFESIIEEQKAEIKSLNQSLKEAENDSITIIEKHKTQMKELQILNRDIHTQYEELKNKSIEGRKIAYDLGVSHTKELKTIEKSLAQKPSEESRKRSEDRLEEIEKEREEALFG